jgi:hypothetical protein
MANDKHENDQQRQQHEQQERERQERERQQHPPGEDHPPHRDAPPRPGEPQPSKEAAPRKPSASEKAAADKQAAAAKEAQAFGSIGAQVILDFNGDGSLGARGGLYPTIEENTAGRDAHYIALGLNPASVSGPPPSMEVRKAREDAAKAQADAADKVQAAHATPGAGAASRVSSLAAGLITDPADVPIAPPPSDNGAQAAHK